MLNQIKEQVKSAIASGKTYSAIAKESEISSATLSQFMNGNYGGDNDKVAQKLTIWLETQQAKSQVKAAPDFVQTQTVTKIWNALSYAQVAGCFVVVYGNSGVGKTGAIQEYAKRPNTWMITARPSASSLNECLYDIALELDIYNVAKRAGSLSRAIVRKLKETQGLLIIDEADHLGYDVLEELRLIQEVSGVGVVLCGNHQIYAKLSGSGSRKTDFARLFSRVAKKVSILNVTSTDVDAIADAWHIKGTKERKLIHALSKKPGALRIIKMTLSLAAIFASAQNQEITEEHINLAIRDLEGV